MFTGIIEEKAVIKKISPVSGAFRLELSVKKKSDWVKKGDSVAINGVCLTAVSVSDGAFEFDITEHTFKNTSLSALSPGGVVNVERALKWSSGIDGHFVLGHVDRASRIKSIKKTTGPCIDIFFSPEDRAYVVKKGSVAVDGISLTIGEVYSDAFRVYIIPYTFENTNLKNKKKNDLVNIEFDILGKYVKNMMMQSGYNTSLINDKFLKERGFI